VSGFVSVGRAVWQLVGREVSPLARREVSQFDFCKANSLEPRHIAAEGTEHPPNLSIATLHQVDNQMRFAF
jgi:hypothetical protein